MIHHIRQQYLHVDLNGTEADGMALQSRLSGLCQYVLPATIERVLDQYAPINGHLLIDRLAIDLGEITLDQLEHELANVVAQKLEKAIRQTRYAVQGSNETKNHLFRTAEETLQDTFIYFLKTGSLPWHFRLPDGKTFEDTLIDATYLEFSWYVKSATFRAVLGSKTVRQRLVRQFSDRFLNQLMAELSPVIHLRINTILQVLKESHISNTNVVNLIKRQLWETGFFYTVSATAITEHELIREIMQACSFPNNTVKLLTDILKKLEPETIQPTDLQQEKPEKDNVAHEQTANRQPDDLLKLADGLYIENAGLVLLHPFLPQFFEGLGLADEQQLTQPERALCLLHFLVTGQTVAPEYTLLLPKLLCNVAFQTPVESNVTLTDAETDEATTLLEAVIRHWDALRSTSPDGLRATFLMRPGKLSLRADGEWLLQVERMSYDILLDQLPWGISMIQLPWMPEMLWVEWA